MVMTGEPLSGCIVELRYEEDGWEKECYNWVWRLINEELGFPPGTCLEICVYRVKRVFETVVICDDVGNNFCLRASGNTVKGFGQNKDGKELAELIEEGKKYNVKLEPIQDSI